MATWGEEQEESGEDFAWKLIDTASTMLDEGSMDAAVQTAQEALTHFRFAGDKRGAERANLLITEVCCRWNKPELAPHRQEAMQLAEQMAAAIKARDAGAFWRPQEQLAMLGVSKPLLSDNDLEELWGPTIKEDPLGCTAFIKANALPESAAVLPLAKFGAEAGRSVTSQGALLEAFYYGFRASGVGYGPRFRCVKFAHKVPVAEKSINNINGVTVLQLSSAAEGWEEELRNNPAILDCILQAASAS